MLGPRKPYETLYGASTIVKSNRGCGATGSGSCAPATAAPAKSAVPTNERTLCIDGQSRRSTAATDGGDSRSTVASVHKQRPTRFRKETPDDQWSSGAFTTLQLIL